MPRSLQRVGLAGQCGPGAEGHVSVAVKALCHASCPAATHIWLSPGSGTAVTGLGGLQAEEGAPEPPGPCLPSWLQPPVLGTLSNPCRVRAWLRELPSC